MKGKYQVSRLGAEMIEVVNVKKKMVLKISKYDSNGGGKF